MFRCTSLMALLLACQTPVASEPELGPAPDGYRPYVREFQVSVDLGGDTVYEGDYLPWLHDRMLSDAAGTCVDAVWLKVGSDVQGFVVSMSVPLQMRASDIILLPSANSPVQTQRMLGYRDEASGLQYAYLDGEIEITEISADQMTWTVSGATRCEVAELALVSADDLSPLDDSVSNCAPADVLSISWLARDFTGITLDLATWQPPSPDCYLAQAGPFLDGDGQSLCAPPYVGECP